MGKSRIRRGRQPPIFFGEIEGKNHVVAMGVDELWNAWKNKKLKKGKEYGGWVTTKAIDSIKERAEKEGYIFSQENFYDLEQKRKRKRFKLKEHAYSDYEIYLPSNDRFT